MRNRFDKFISKDTELSPNRGKDLPNSNDFIEGAHGTVSMVQKRLPHCNPERVASIAQRKHNQYALKALEISIVPSPETHAKFRKRKLNSNEEVHRRIHNTAMSQQLRTEYKNLSVDRLRELAMGASISTVGSNGKHISLASLSWLLVDASYKKPASGLIVTDTQETLLIHTKSIGLLTISYFLFLNFFVCEV